MTPAYAQGSFLQPPEGATAEDVDEGASPQIIPGLGNDDLSFIVLLVVLGLGLIWIWVRGQTMSAEAEVNAAMLARAANKRAVVMSEEDMAAANQAAEAAEQDPDVRSMAAQRIGLKGQN